MTDELETEIEIRRKRLKFRAWHRGMQEADLILGRFADAHLWDMSDEELDQFEQVLELMDQDILNWIMKREPLPADQNTPVMQKILTYDSSEAVKR